MNALFTPTGFLRYGGIVLLLVAIVGFLGIFNSFSFFSLDTGENYAHLVLGVVGIGVGFGLKNAGLNKLLTLALFATALVFTVWGLLLPDGGALKDGAFAKPNFYGLANLESPADSILHLVVTLWAGLALYMDMKQPAAAAAPVPSR